MIDKFTKDSAAEAGFTVEDAKTCGWHIHEPGKYELSLRAEKYDPNRGMLRFSRDEEAVLLEEIFKIERAKFEKERALDMRPYQAWLDAIKDLLDVRSNLSKVPPLPHVPDHKMELSYHERKAGMDEYERGRARHNVAWDAYRRRFDAAWKRIQELQDAAFDCLETHGHDVTAMRACAREFARTRLTKEKV